VGKVIDMTPETKAKIITNPEFGQTPWENFTKEELILECARMWSVIVMVLQEEMTRRRRDDETDDYIPLSVVRLAQIVEDIPPSEANYRAFFRFKDGLLFNDSDPWRICDNCNSMWGSAHHSPYCPGCMATGKGDVPTRPLTLADIRPKKGETL
jgi:hypothetical protein